MKPITTALLAGSVALAACGPSNDPVYTQFYREAGAIADTGAFGNATANNTLILTGERQYSFDLAQRFASEVLTTVNFAFNSSQDRKSTRLNSSHPSRSRMPSSA